VCAVQNGEDFLSKWRASLIKYADENGITRDKYAQFHRVADRFCDCDAVQDISPIYVQPMDRGSPLATTTTVLMNNSFRGSTNSFRGSTNSVPGSPVATATPVFTNSVQQRHAVTGLQSSQRKYSGEPVATGVSEIPGEIALTNSSKKKKKKKKPQAGGESGTGGAKSKKKKKPKPKPPADDDSPTEAD
jgi:hypothetical protein